MIKLTGFLLSSPSSVPKFITLPRRRRRRRRNPDEPANAADAEARDLAEAQRRSLADTMGGGRSSNRRDRSNRSNGDDGQTPSAAFDERLDEMLREVSFGNRTEVGNGSFFPVLLCSTDTVFLSLTCRSMRISTQETEQTSNKTEHYNIGSHTKKPSFFQSKSTHEENNPSIRFLFRTPFFFSPRKNPRPFHHPFHCTIPPYKSFRFIVSGHQPTSRLLALI